MSKRVKFAHEDINNNVMKLQDSLHDTSLDRLDEIFNDNKIKTKKKKNKINTAHTLDPSIYDEDNGVINLPGSI